MRVLVLGGTSFIGRHTVETALLLGHRVTLFHRGRTNPSLFPGAEHRYGDRATGDYTELLDGTWDVVIDVSAYLPRAVAQAAAVLAGKVGHYVQVSSISAYDPAANGDGTEDDHLHGPLPEPTTQSVTPATYGPLKAECEREARRRLDPDVAIVRPTYVAGPHDPTDRFTYWARRMARGGDILVTTGDRPIQLIDVRDLAAFLVIAATRPLTGAFDAVGPAQSVTELLNAITPPGVTARLRSVAPDVLAGSGVLLPFLPVRDDVISLMTRSGARARAAGLESRPLTETADATRAWDAERGTPPLTVGPTPEREAELIAQFAAPATTPGPQPATADG